MIPFQVTIREVIFLKIPYFGFGLHLKENKKIAVRERLNLIEQNI